MKKIILLPVVLLFGIMAHCQEVLKLQTGSLLTLEPGAEFTVFGDVSFDNGSTISNSGIFTVKQNGSSGTANFLDNTITAYSYGSGKFVFNSTINHSIYSNNNFGQIDVDAASLTLGSDITANKWWLEKGNVITSNYKAIVLGVANSDLEAGPSNINFTSSYIIGNLRRYLNAAANDIYLFPLGTSARKNFAEMNNLNAVPLDGVQFIDASFGAKPGTDAGLAVSENSSQYVSVNSGGVWHLVSNNIPSLGKYNLKLSFDGFTGLGDNSFTILQRPDLSTDAAEWKVPVGSSVNATNGAGRLVADGYALRKDVSVFGQFGIAQLSSALPVTLANFDVRRLSKYNVQLNWQTQSESNNKGFGIERRLENETYFATNGFVNSKAINGNSSTNLTYDFNDNNSYAGVTYYRLKQTDIDNRSFYTQIKAVKGLDGSSVSVLLWPNPARGQFSIKMDGIAGDKEASVTDLQGKLIRKIIIAGNVQVNINGLSAGVYILTIPDVFGRNENFKEKIIVTK